MNDLMMFLTLFIGVVVLIVFLMVSAGRRVERKEREIKALTEITVDMKKDQVDSVLGYGQLEKTTKTYIQYRYMETTKLGNVSYSINYNLKGGRYYFHNRKSYMSIKFSKDTMKVIEIVNKL